MAKILLIDDSVSVLSSMREVLESASHEVLSASSGRQGIRILQTVALDLIITDIYMPESDGIEVIQEAQKLTSRPKLIAISGKPPQYDMLPAARALGAVCTLAKPFGPETLLDTVSRVLGIESPANGSGASPPRHSGNRRAEPASAGGDWSGTVVQASHPRS